jgi:hypothetical protein
MVLAVDPGREKCGVAVCGPEGVYARTVVAATDLGAVARRLVSEHRVDAVIVGDQTSSKQAFAILSELPLPVTLVPERGSTLRARRRYFKDHQPRGWRRFLPLAMLVPPVPYDDYTAVVLAEEYLGRPPATARQDQGKAAAGSGQS